MQAPEYSSKNSKVEKLSQTCAVLLLDLPQGPRALVWGSNKVSWSFLLIRFVGGRVEETNQENYRFFMALYRKYRQAKRLRFTTESFSVDNWNAFFSPFAPKTAVGYCLFVTIQQNNAASEVFSAIFLWITILQALITRITLMIQHLYYFRLVVPSHL